MRWLNNAWLAGLGVIISGLALLWRSTLKGLTTVQITPRQDLKIAEGARPYFDEFKGLGFDHIASADVRYSNFETVFAYLISSDRRTYVVVTDKLQCLGSRFGRGVMVTIDRAAFPTGPLQLRQVVPTSDLAELVEVHRAGLAAVAAHGHQPDELVPERTLEFSMGIDQSAVAYLRSHPWLVLCQYLWGTFSGQRPDSHRLIDDPVTRRRIERWQSV